ncbi:hypothetical protein LCGC14_0725510 [marine sediment metagenome]|uniref:Uncharacterized protein n=1 Tax=marine sediment metagenome TaxID=412755 RepID=A0A0F9QB35_9ZZZZ
MNWLKFLRKVLGNGNGMNVMQYLQTEIKPSITGLQKGHEHLTEMVAERPTRTELDTRLDRIHKRIDTKQDKQ